MKKDKEWLESVIIKELMTNSGNPDMTTYEQGRVSALKYYLKLIDQLDESEKVVVSKMEKVVIPQFVADWYEKNKRDLTFGIYMVMKGIIKKHDSECSKIEDWFNHSIHNPVETVVLMKSGYTIEKEPDKLYEVKLPTENAMGNTMNLVQGGSKNRVWFDSLDDRIVKFKFTEKEIKSIDERYWAFAVEVMPNE